VTLRKGHRLKVFLDRVLRGICSHKGNEIVADREQFIGNNMHSSPNILTMIESRRTGWAEHVACRGIEEYMQDFGG
jgi:hypothetical protein